MKNTGQRIKNIRKSKTHTQLDKYQKTIYTELFVAQI